MAGTPEVARANGRLGGRPKGTTDSVSKRRKFQDYFTEEEVKQLIKDLKDAMMGDPILAKFVLEQLFGKAPQRVEMSGPEGKPIPLLHALISTPLQLEDKE